MSRQITVYQILSVAELSLFEPAEDTAAEKVPDVEKAMRLSAFEKLDKAVADVLSVVMLMDLTTEAECHHEENTFMFYIQGSITPRPLWPGHQKPGWLPG